MTSPRLLRHPPTSSLSNKSLLGDQNYPWGYPQWLTTPTHLNPSPSSSVTIDHVPPDKAISPLSNNSRISLYDDTVEMEDTYVVEDKKNGIKANHPSNRKITMDKLLPKDIELIGCLGDSLFTGLGVTAFPSKWKNKIYQWYPYFVVTILGYLDYIRLYFRLFKYNKLIPWILSGEHRQNTCILGGGKGVISVGRLLKRYNPALQGLNTRKTRMFSRGSDYNFATTGAKSQNLRMQTIRMVRRFKRDRTTHSVKILFLWIGVNDAFSKSHKSLEKTFVGDIVTALALIKTHLPNTFVCILPLPNLGQVLKDVGSEKRTKIISKIKLINQLLWDVTNDWDFNGDYYFRVTFQPIPFDDLDNPEFLNMYPLISTLDDQHPSFIAQQLFAKCIWNNLFLKPEHKVTSIQQVIDSAWYEPTEDDYCQ